jgi:pimeloyl-ACP methyl ester carboxylesterase
MDPFHRSVPASSGHVAVAPGVELYYERRGSAAAPEKVILLMGAYGTLRHLDELADSLAAAQGGERFEVLTCDHRGVGRSRVARSASWRLLAQTTQLLAADAHALLRAVWPSGARLHVFGVSMGGMVAQRLALSLLAAQDDSASGLRLASLTLSVTARCYGLARYVPMPPPLLLRLGMVLLLRIGTPAAVVRYLLPRCFPHDVLAAPHPAAPERSYGELWRQRWCDEYTELFALHDAVAVAEQASVVMRHYLTDAEAATLRGRVPILVKAAARDRLIAPRAQHELARLLDAALYESHTGHFGDAADHAAFVERMARHMQEAPTAPC